jgi:hypothetical protein
MAVFRRTFATLAVALTLAPASLLAQDPPREGPLPPEVQAHVLELVNRGETLRLQGLSRIPAGTRVEGDVVVLGGSLHLGGEILGELVVVNGDLLLAPGARVEGPVWVVGGRVEGLPEARLAQDPRVYRAPLRYRIRAGRVEGPPAPTDVAPRFLAADLGFGRTRFTLRAAGAYNRVEGFPVQFGPVIETRGRNPMTLEAFGIWRSAGGFDLDTERMGYHFVLNQAMGGRGTAAVGVESFSRVQAIEDRGMTDLESSLATFLMHRDYRDYYDTEGWSAFFELTPARTPLRLRAGYREEEHALARIEDPWTLRRGDDPWRPQPLVATGTGRYLETRLELDTRDDPVHPTDGWWLRVDALQQVGGRLRHVDPSVPDGPAAEATGVYPRVTWAGVDLRRYARISPTSHLRIRFFLAGAPDRAALPPQFQSALGGEGSLPGHPRFALDCGARSTTFPDPEGGPELIGGYGCDEMALTQIELQRTLPLEWSPLPEAWTESELGGTLQFQPTLSAFINAGQGWNRSGGSPFTDARNSPSRADIGFGVSTGGLGFYWAYPLNRKDQGLNFFVRLQHRF